MLHQLIPSELLDSDILVVDDDDWNCAYVFEVLSAYGFRAVRTISNSSEALEAIRLSPPDLLLLDIYMPPPDGFAILEALKSVLPEGKQLPVLVITSDEDHDVKQRALQLGASDFLPKPFEEIVVAARVANLLRVSQGHQLSSQAVQAGDAPLSSETLQVLLSKIPAGVVLVDSKGAINYANDEFCRIFSIRAAAEELTGESWDDAIEGLKDDFHDGDAFAESDRWIRGRARAVDRELLSLLDGRILERDYVPLTLQGGQGHLWIFRDVTLANTMQTGAAS